ncbi:MAG TPA: hypothetical protein ENN56_03840 [Firmicutes bacterium]|nr:hypothetical protein [Bacillota bacterium]
MNNLHRTLHFGALLVMAVTISCTPPPPITDAIVVDARTEHWQSQIAGAGPNAGVNVKTGDEITLAIDGKITYDRSLHGLRKDTSGPWGVRAPKPEAWCPEARIGALVWRIGDDGPCLSLDKVSGMTFTADRDGQLQFLVNDIKGGYGDNSGSFRVTVTIQRR